MVKAEFDIYGVGILEDGMWSIPNTPKFEKVINKYMSQLDIPGSEPNPPYAAAKMCVSMFSGKIIEFTTPKYVKGRVY